MINLQPLNDHVLIKLTTAEEEKTASGIIIPDSARSNDDEGEIVAVPPGAGEEVAVGDRVLFKKTSATEVSDGDDKYLLMPFKDLIGKYVDVDSI